MLGSTLHRTHTAAAFRSMHVTTNTETLQIDGSPLSGTIPTEIGLLSNLGMHNVLLRSLCCCLGCCRRRHPPFSQQGYPLFVCLFVCLFLCCRSLQHNVSFTGKLSIERTRLEGQIPTELGRLSQLSEFYGQGMIQFNKSFPVQRESQSSCVHRNECG